MTAVINPPVGQSVGRLGQSVASPSRTRLHPAPGSLSAARAVGPLAATDSQLSAWVADIAALTEPDDVVWVDGTDAEWDRLTSKLAATGTFTRLEAKPNSFYCASHPHDAARVEDRTFICSEKEADAGATNNWMAPAEMKAVMTELYRGSMRGRTMYVIPFCMGPYDADVPMLGVAVTDYG